jgi:hypothetical protein
MVGFRDCSALAGGGILAPAEPRAHAARDARALIGPSIPRVFCARGVGCQRTLEVGRVNDLHSIGNTRSSDGRRLVLPPFMFPFCRARLGESDGPLAKENNRGGLGVFVSNIHQHFSLVPVLFPFGASSLIMRSW